MSARHTSARHTMKPDAFSALVLPSLLAASTIALLLLWHWCDHDCPQYVSEDQRIVCDVGEWLPVLGLFLNLLWWWWWWRRTQNDDLDEKAWFASLTYISETCFRHYAVLPLFLVWSAFYGVIADIWSGEDWVKSLVLDSAGLLSAISLLVATGEKFMHADVDDDERRCAPRRGAPARARASATRALV